MNYVVGNKLVSIIIPVYNSGKKLNRCVESLLSQTYNNIEIIIIDDKSPDKQTLEIEDKWQNRDDRVKIFRNEVNGKPEPRLHGINEAQGEYICFSDQDDWMPKNAIANMVSAIEKYDADIIIGQVTKAVKFGPFRKEFQHKSNLNLVGKVIEKPELMEHYFYSYFGLNILPVSVWGRLYKRELFNRAYKDIESSSKIATGAGDIMFSMSLHPYVNRLCIIESDVYSYYIGLPGISPKYLKLWLPRSNKLFAYKWEMLDKYDFHKADKYLAIEMINYLKTFVRLCAVFDRDNKENHISVIKTVLQDHQWQKVAILANMDYDDPDIVSLVIKNEAEDIYAREEAKVLNAPILTRIKYFIHKSLVRFKS